MSAAVTAAWIGGLTGLAGGGVASLLAPWSQWGVDKRRATRETRLALLQSWREGLADHAGWERPHGSFIDSAWYMSLRPHLSPDVLQYVEQRRHERIVVTTETQDGSDTFAVAVAADIDRNQREWKLA